MRKIDLDGPDGNAHYLLGLARQWCRDLGRDPAPVLARMKESDYDHLCDVFEQEFTFVRLIRPEQEGD